MGLFEELRAGSAVALISPPLGGKEELVALYIKAKLKRKEPVLVISTDCSAEGMKQKLVKKGIFFGDAESRGLLAFIDCYSMHVGETAKDTQTIKRIPSPLALNEISVALANMEREFLKKGKMHSVIFNSISTMLMYSNPQAIGRFVQVIIAKIKKSGGLALFTLEEGMHGPDVLVTMEHLMDVLIFVKQENRKLFVKARGIKGFEDWAEFSCFHPARKKEKI